MALIDSISNLPDVILHHILSLLDIQEAVQTCVLSKRWERLWCSTQSLDLSLPDFRTQKPNMEKRFARFVNMVLSQRDPSDLHDFHLFCDESNFNVRHRLITSWMLYAIRHNAKVIEVDACMYRSLPQDMFTSSSLQELILGISGLGKGVVAGGINLPQLRKLHLCGIMSRKRAILTTLVSGCPILEDLSLKVCSIDISAISSPTLKHLSIYSRLDTSRIKALKAPNLISLHLDLRGDVLHAANFEMMPFLVNATIYVDSGSGFDVNCNIISTFPNIRNLRLGGSVMKDLLRVELPKCPTFFNLTELHLRQLCQCYDSKLGDIMSSRSPNLKNVSLSKSSWCYQCANNDSDDDF